MSGTAETDAAATAILYEPSKPGGRDGAGRGEAGVATATLKNYIGGRWVEAEGVETLDVTNPASGEPLGVVLSQARPRWTRPFGLREAFPGWRAPSPVERARACFELKYRLEAALDELASSSLATTARRSRMPPARSGAGSSASRATGIPSLMQGTNLEDVSRGIDSDMIRQPIGVFAAVTPFNFPFMVPMWFLPFAIACGNTFVCKPSEQDPLTVQKTFEPRGRRAPGVVNLVHGGKPAVDAILEHPGIDGVSFVGPRRSRTTSTRPLPSTGSVQALGGAKNHVIVMPDAELDSAADGVLSSAFHAAGQRCLANSVCIAVGNAYEPLKKALADKGGAMVVGDGADPETEVGPVISAVSQERILG